MLTSGIKVADPNRSWDNKERSTRNRRIANKNMGNDYIGPAELRNNTILIKSSTLDGLDSLGKALNMMKIEHMTLRYQGKFEDH